MREWIKKDRPKWGARLDCHKKGRLGEDLAVKYLLDKGFEVVARNARVGRYEIDIIGRKNQQLIFFEVKSCYVDDGDSPLYRIDALKLQHLHKAALGYIAREGCESDYQLMAISVFVKLSDRTAKIEVVDCGWN